MTKRIDELIATICGPAELPIAPLLRQWCAESRLFLDFAEAHASKIRKKARLTSADAQADLSAELAIAAALARDRRFSVRYEPYLASGQRGPDFQVLFRAHTTLHVEVTRLRPPESAGGEPASGALKLARAICDKVGQLPPGAINLLSVVVPPAMASAALVPAAIHLLDSAGSPAHELRPDDLRAYARLRPRLSAIALCPFTDDWRALASQLWLNPQAKHPLAPEIARYLAQLGAAG